MAERHKQEKWLMNISWLALGFAGIMSVLVILNFFQLSRVDPVNTEVINTLVERLQENPADDQLREQIRELDLLARKAYFTNRWQVRYGAYIILISLAVFVFIRQYINLGKRQHVAADPDTPKDIIGINKNARKGISILGALLVLTALLLAFLTHRKLSDPQIQTETVPAVAQQENMQSSGTFQPGEIEQIENLEIPEEDISAANPETSNAGDKVAIEKEIDSSISEDKRQDDIEEPAEKKDPYPDAATLRKNAPYFRGHNSNGKIYQENVPVRWNGTTGENILWKTKINIKSYNSPIVWEDKIFLTGANENTREVYCYSKNDGSLLWSKQITGIPGSPAVPPKTTEDTGLGAASMTTDGSRVYAIFGTGDLVALDMEGKQVWAKNLGVPQNHYGHSSSLIMHQQKLIVQYDQKSNGRLMAFEASSGKPLWSTPRNEKVSWASPVLIYHENKSQIILVADPTVAAYDPWTGKQLWSLECISGEVGPSACFDDGIVYAVNDYANIAAIDLNDPTTMLWENADILSDIPSPVASNGLLIMPTSYGLIACYDGKTGEILWEHEYDDNVFSSPIINGQKVYTLDTSGKMHIFKLSGESYQEIAVNPLGEDAVSTPAFADGRIYIRTDNHLYCIGNK